MIWNKKKDGAENPGTETSAAQTAKAPVLFLQKNWKWLVPVVCVVIAGGVFLLKPKSASTTAVDPSYLETSPEVRDVSNTLSGTGYPGGTVTVKMGGAPIHAAVTSVTDATTTAAALPCSAAAGWFKYAPNSSRSKPRPAINRSRCSGKRNRAARSRSSTVSVAASSASGLGG